jgi:thymidylate synthase (FAD)
METTQLKIIKNDKELIEAIESGVKLISHSSNALDSLDKSTNLEDMICYCARVSNPSNQTSTLTNSKLIKYLIANAHWSPFEMVSICLEINTTRDIGRQILRHRSFSFQEFSQRYAVADLGFEIRQARLQDLKNRQSSLEIVDDGSGSGLELETKWKELQKELCELASSTYSWAISNGIAKEQARAVLPEGNTMTRMYMSGTLRSWIHYIQLRSGNGTQKEHKEIAIQCAQAIKPIFPSIDNFLS